MIQKTERITSDTTPEAKQNPVRREIKYAKRVIGMLAKYAIRNDPVRSLVELVTNSDDSFNRMGAESGKIDIAVKRGHNFTYVIVSDNAEGMTYEQMDNCVGGYGFETSGFQSGYKVRGLFGRGLKEAILGLGIGIVRSIKDGLYTEAKLEMDGMYEIRPARRATLVDYEELGLKEGEDGTQVAIEIKGREAEVRMPQFETLKMMLEKHVSLRDIMTNENRIVTLHYLNKNKAERLSYKYPAGQLVLEKRNVPVKGYPKAMFTIEVNRAEVDLSQVEDTLIRDGGLLIRSGNSIHEATLFKFDDNQYARKFYGEIRCEYITELMRNGEPIISDKRDGLERKHPFVKVLKDEVEALLEPLIEEEKKRYESERRLIESQKTLRKFNEAIREFNMIAKDELKAMEGSVKMMSTPMEVLASDQQEGAVFAFSTPYCQIIANKTSILYLHTTVPELLPVGTKIRIKSDTKDLEIEDSQFQLNEEDIKNGKIVKKITVEGKRVGVNAIVTAVADNNMKAMCKVKVISRKEEADEPEPRRTKSGLFRVIRYNNMDNPQQRAYFDRTTGTVEIYTKNDSVKMYTGINGENQDDPKSLVLVAELTTDVVCKNLAKIKDERQMIAYTSEEARFDAVYNEYARLKTKYAGRIHKILIGRQARKKVIANTLEEHI